MAPVRTVTWLNCEYKVLILGKSEALNLRLVLVLLTPYFPIPAYYIILHLKKNNFNGLHIVECTVLCIEFRLMIFQKKTSLQKVSHRHLQVFQLLHFSCSSSRADNITILSLKSGCLLSLISESRRGNKWLHKGWAVKWMDALRLDRHFQ